MEEKHHGLFADYVEDEQEEREDYPERYRQRAENPRRRSRGDRKNRRSAAEPEQNGRRRKTGTLRTGNATGGNTDVLRQRHRESETWDDEEIRRRRREREMRNRKRKRRHPIRNLILILLVLLICWVAFAVIRGNTGKEVTNILLIGQDRRDGEGTERSDSMILATINRRTKKITLTSIMRDLYVDIPGHGRNRINEAYSEGGMKLLDRTIEENLDLEIDGNAEVDFDHFIKAMTSVGNLDINLKDYEAKYLNVNSSYGGVENYAWNLHAGMNSLTPRQALAYSRIRYVGNSDWERTQRQRTVITTAFNKVKKQGPLAMIHAASKVFPCLTTDVSKSDMMGLVSAVVLNNMKIGDTLRVPFDGTYQNETLDSGAQVLTADMDQNAKLLHQHLYTE